jgi:hypothetical protein
VPEDIVGRLFGELAGADLPVPPTGAVIARGRQRRRRTRVKAALAVAAATTLVVVGATQLAGLRTRSPSPGSHRGTPHSVCLAAPDRALSAELAQRLAIGTKVIALDGTLAYADVTVPGFHGIAEESVATGAIVKRIYRLPARDDSAAGALTRNGDLIWVSYYNRGGDYISAGSTPVRLWSPRTGAVTVLEPAGQDGVPLSAPVLFSNQGGLAAWLQEDGRRTEIVEANLATRAVDVIARGYFGPPVFVGTALVWSGFRSASGPASGLVAVDAIPFPAHQAVALPRALRSAGPGAQMGSEIGGSWPPPIGLIASDAGVTAYFSASLTELFYSPELTQPARLVLRLPGNVAFSPGSLAVGDGYLAWSTDSAASYVASTRSLAAATITNGTTDYGDVASFGGYVLAESTRTPKHGSLKVSLISGSTIDGLVCAASRPAGR